MPRLILRPTIILLRVVSCLAETNRTPFNFSEGESELMSGFNVEYGLGGFFALIFIAEYAIIFYLSILRAFLGAGWLPSNLIRYIITVLLVFFEHEPGRHCPDFGTTY